MYSAAPWSINHVRPCHGRMFGLATLRSGLVANASSHTTSAACSGSTSGAAAGLKVRAPGRKSGPSFRPPLRWTRSLQFLVGFCVAHAGVDIDQDDLGDVQSELP